MIKITTINQLDGTIEVFEDYSIGIEEWHHIYVDLLDYTYNDKTGYYEKENEMVLIEEVEDQMMIKILIGLITISSFALLWIWGDIK